VISRVAVSLITCAGDSAPRSGRIGSDKCQQLETDIQRYRKLLEQSLDPQTIEIQSYRKLLALGLDPLTIERIDGVIQEISSAQASLFTNSEPAGDEHRFFASSRQEGRRPPGACDPLGRFLLARAVRGELPDDAALLTHQGVVSVNLAGKSRPAASEMFQSLGFSLALR
jgi:hypothetical protein